MGRPPLIQWHQRKTRRRTRRPCPSQRLEQEPRRRSGPRERFARSLTTWSSSTRPHDRMLAEVKNFKLVTPSAISERLKVNGSLARRAIQKLLEAGLIRPIETHARQAIYTRNTGDDDAEE